MSKKQYDAVVFVGRFQPFHNAHLNIIKKANEYADTVVVVLGSANMPRTTKNPFTIDERIEMITSSVNTLTAPTKNLLFSPVEDSIYNDIHWAADVQAAVGNHIKFGSKVAIIGHKKDETSFYLDMFPQWDLIEVEEVEPLDATKIRDIFLTKQNLNLLLGVVPTSVFEFLFGFRGTEHYCQLVDEYKFIQDYKKQFDVLPYPPVFVTSDAVVFQSGHVLLIKRRAEPGKGLWALPGGFLNAHTDKSVLECAIRELKEETGIKVPVPVLKGSVESSKVFDAISRSARGRTITHAFKIVLNDGPLPKVRGSDDAEKAKWVPIGEVRREDLFEDHYDIIKNFVGN